MAGLGTFVNAGSILGGATFGLLFDRLIPERVRTTLLQAIGLAVMGLGLQMTLDPRVDHTALAYTGPRPYHPNFLVVIGGLVAGSLLGELLHLEQRLEDLGHALHRATTRFIPSQQTEAASGSHRLVEGFVTASLIYCIGAMSVIGAIQDATGQPHVLYVKALLDGISAIVLASSLGIGVALSIIPVILYQGGITLAAHSVASYLTLPVLATLTATGGLLIAAIGLDLTGIKRLPIANMLPGVFLAAILAYFAG